MSFIHQWVYMKVLVLCRQNTWNNGDDSPYHESYVNHPQVRLLLGYFSLQISVLCTLTSVSVRNIYKFPGPESPVVKYRVESTCSAMTTRLNETVHLYSRIRYCNGNDTQADREADSHIHFREILDGRNKQLSLCQRIYWTQIFKGGQSAGILFHSNYIIKYKKTIGHHGEGDTEGDFGFAVLVKPVQIFWIQLLAQKSTVGFGHLRSSVPTWTGPSLQEYAVAPSPSATEQSC